MIKVIIYAIATPCVIIVIGKLVEFLSSSVLKTLFPKMWLFISIYILAPGVIFHELCHFLVALCTGAKIYEVNLYKVERTLSGYNLGSVSYAERGPFILRSIQSFCASCAPTVIGLIAMFWLYKYGFYLRPEMWYKVLIVYCFICLSVHIDLSNADIKCMLKGCPIVVILLACLFYFTKFEPTMLIETAKSLISFK